MRINTPIGVTTKKYTNPIIRGETIVPNKIPNFNHSLFSGVNNLELRTPKIKKIVDKASDHHLISPSYFKGHKAIIKKTTKNTNPKLLFDGTFVFEFEDMLLVRLSTL